MSQGRSRGINKATRTVWSVKRCNDICGFSKVGMEVEKPVNEWYLPSPRIDHRQEETMSQFYSD